MIQFEKVSYRYPFQDKWAVKNINLEVLPGQVVLITGVSGCGKTTLKWALSALLRRRNIRTSNYLWRRYAKEFRFSYFRQDRHAVSGSRRSIFCPKRKR